MLSKPNNTKTNKIWLFWLYKILSKPNNTKTNKIWLFWLYKIWLYEVEQQKVVTIQLKDIGVKVGQIVIYLK